MYSKHKFPFTFSASQIFRHKISAADAHIKGHPELPVDVAQGHRGVTTAVLT